MSSIDEACDMSSAKLRSLVGDLSRRGNVKACFRFGFSMLSEVGAVVMIAGVETAVTKSSVYIKSFEANCTYMPAQVESLPPPVLLQFLTIANPKHAET